MRIVTGNDLGSGAVVWWTGEGWSLFVADAVDVGEGAEAVAAEEEAARRVNAPYVIEATESPDGPMPAHIKDRIRSLGPTVRGDLALKRDPSAGNYVI
ncbi:DUF2849 domain-containing protein [Sphingoaurantiacus capsulatus]|uniref:DUF2849 domain-containing protein n=1 Tax=Sphingoaurantiacus capsulatus TaxID=1771310 RepID=A0ABV7XF27_9SPHN